MKLRRKLVATILSVMMIFNAVVQPLSAVGTESGEPKESIVITNATIDSSDAMQSLTQGSTETVRLPKLNVTYSDTTTDSIDVTWASDVEFNVNNVGIYTYSATLDNTLYTLGEGVVLPQFTVEVKAVTPNPVAFTPTTITSDTFVDYNSAGNPLWNYTTANSFIYTVEYSYEKPVTEPRVFVIDINPNNIDDFPFWIESEEAVANTVSADIMLDDNNTLLTYTIPESSMTLDTGGGNFTITLSLKPSQSLTSYPGAGNTAAAAVGNTLLENAKNGITPKFGVTLDDNISAGVEIRQDHVPNLYDPTWTDAKILGDTIITGSSADATYKYDQIGAISGNSNLWLSSNGDIYFGDDTSFINTSSSSYYITTPITSTNHLPIGNFTYIFNNVLNSHVKTDNTSTIVGSATSITETLGYGEDSLASPVSSTFVNNEHHYFEGSLKTINSNESISIALSSIKYNTGDNFLDDLQDKKVKYITSSVDSSRITYDQLVVETKNTDSKLDDTYTYKTVTHDIPEVVLNVPNFTYTDRLDTVIGSGLVRESTTTLEFDLENVFQQSSYKPGLVATETYANHTLTIDIPENVKASSFSTYADYPEEKIFTHYQTVKNGVTSGEIEAVWNDKDVFSIQNLQDVDKIILHISDTGIFSGNFTDDLGNVTSNLYRNYDKTFRFDDCDVSRPTSDIDTDTGRFPMPMEIYLTDPDGTVLTQPIEDDLTINWQFEAPAETDVDNLSLTLFSEHSSRFSSLELNNPDRDTDVYTAKITPRLNGELYYFVDSRVFKDVQIDFNFGQEKQIELISEIVINKRISGGGEEFSPISNDATVSIYYTTDKNPNVELKTFKSADYRYIFTPPRGEYLTSVRIVVDEMMLNKQNTDTLVRNGFDFIVISMDRTPTVSNGDIPVTDLNGDGRVSDTLTLEMTSEQFGSKKSATATTYFSYDKKTVNLISVNGVGTNSSSKNGQENKTLQQETVLYYEINDKETETDEEVINSNFPVGSAIYLKLNPTYFEYVGPQTSKLTRVMDSVGEEWLRFDISGGNGTGDVTIPAGTILVKKEIPTSPAGGVQLFSSAYLDTNPLLAVDYLDNNFVDYSITEGGIAAPNEITKDSNERYGITEANGLVEFTGSDGKNPTELMVEPVIAFAAGLGAVPQINEDGHVEVGSSKEGSREQIRYYAHESDDLELGIVLSTFDEALDKTVTIVLPNDSDTMKITLRGDIYNSLTPEQKTLVGEEGNITYYSDANASTIVTPDGTYSNVKSVKILIPKLEERNVENLTIQLKADPVHVYSKPDDSLESVTVNTDLVTDDGLIVDYIFDWYEVSGIVYAEPLNKDDGEYNATSGDKYLSDILNKDTMPEDDPVGRFYDGTTPIDASLVSYVKSTGKYTVIIQPKELVNYNVKFEIEDDLKTKYAVSSKLPVVPAVDYALNNNYTPAEGVKFTANITNGMSPIVDVAKGDNLTQHEVDFGMIDLALVESPVYLNVYYVVEDTGPYDLVDLIFQQTGVLQGSTLTTPTDAQLNVNGYTTSGKTIIGWNEIDPITGDVIAEWTFGDAGDTVEHDTYLRPILKAPPTITFEIIDPYIDPKDKVVGTDSEVIPTGTFPSEPTIVLDSKYNSVEYSIPEKWFYYNAANEEVIVDDLSKFVVVDDITLYKVIQKTITVTFDALVDMDTIESIGTINNMYDITVNKQTGTIRIPIGENVDFAPITTDKDDKFKFEFWYIDLNGNNVYDASDIEYSNTHTYIEPTVYLAHYSVAYDAMFVFYNEGENPLDVSNILYFAAPENLSVTKDQEVFGVMPNSAISMGRPLVVEINALDQDSVYTEMLEDEKITGWKLHYITPTGDIEYLKNPDGTDIIVGKSSGLPLLSSMEFKYENLFTNEGIPIPLTLAIFIHPIIESTETEVEPPVTPPTENEHTNPDTSYKK